jgi:hypothetical protein
MIKIVYIIRNFHNLFLFSSGRNSINRTPDALSSMDCVDDSLFPNQAGMSKEN